MRVSVFIVAGGRSEIPKYRCLYESSCTTDQYSQYSRDWNQELQGNDGQLFEVVYSVNEPSVPSTFLRNMSAHTPAEILAL